MGTILDRKKIVEELDRVGAYDERAMHSFSDSVLEAVLLAFRNTTSRTSRDLGQDDTSTDVLFSQSSSDSNNTPKLTKVEVKVLTFLASSKVRESVLSLKKLGIPTTTLQRKRKWLE